MEQGYGGVRKYGITNRLENRLRAHRPTGFIVVLEALACVDGAVAWQIESAIRDHLVAIGAKPALTLWDMPQGGWTETYEGVLAPELRPFDMAIRLGLTADHCWLDPPMMATPPSSGD